MEVQRRYEIGDVAEQYFVGVVTPGEEDGKWVSLMRLGFNRGLSFEEADRLSYELAENFSENNQEVIVCVSPMGSELDKGWVEEKEPSFDFEPVNYSHYERNVGSLAVNDYLRGLVEVS